MGGEWSGVSAERAQASLPGRGGREAAYHSRRSSGNFVVPPSDAPMRGRLSPLAVFTKRCGTGFAQVGFVSKDCIPIFFQWVLFL